MTMSPGMASAPLGIAVAGILTMVVLSYLWSDSMLYRVVEHAFIGISAGYAVVVAVQQVLVPDALGPLVMDGPQSWMAAVPLFLATLLVCRVWKPVSWLANLPLGLVLGVGVGLGITGSLAGTIVPQLLASVPPGTIGVDTFVGAAVFVVSTIAFTYSASTKRIDHRINRQIASVGQVIIMFALGALFAELATSRLSLLASRLQFLVTDWLGVISHGI